MSKRKPFDEYCPRCDKTTKWLSGEPYQRGFQKHTCQSCKLTISDDWEEFWHEPDDEEKEQLRQKYS